VDVTRLVLTLKAFTAVLAELVLGWLITRGIVKVRINIFFTNV
jgi:hypothetical protein